ncbi:hypothetical protein [Haloarchaeobius sp. HRN-SO-5]|uniref:hypothetical protein n=1 Tax=Haloarchaeobius sp. HRN-SO-5 TaxID=3446118 RepID=UPI003EB80C4D
MSQQLQQPTSATSGVQQEYQPQYQAQTQMGQQFQGSQVGQFMGRRFQETVPHEVQQAVSDLEKFETLMEWAKSRAVQRGRPRVAARCDDLAQIAHLEKGLILRESPFAEPIGHATRQTIQQGIQELQQRASEPEVQEALQQGQQTAQAISNALGRLQSFGQQGMQQQVQQPVQQQGTQQYQQPQTQY